MDTLFIATQSARRQSDLQTFVAPFSRGGQTVLADPAPATAMTLAIAELFLETEVPPALTRGEIAEALSPQYPREQIEAHVDRLRAGRVLLAARGRARESRYRLKMVGYLGALFAERVDDAGLLDEFWTLLDRARGRLSRGEMDAEALAAEVETIRRGLVGFAGELQAVSETGTRDEVVAECRRHDRGGRAAQVEELCRTIELRFPALSAKARELIVAAQAYVDAVQRLVSRLRADGLAASELFLLDAADYDDAARTLSADRLAQFAASVVVDRPQVLLDADALIEATTSELAAPTLSLRRPPEPSTDERDPLAEGDRQSERRRGSLIDNCERLLQGQAQVALAEHLSKLASESAMRELSVLIEAHLRADVPYELRFADGVRVDSSSLRALSWLTPLTLARAGAGPIGPVRSEDDVEALDG